MRSKKTKLIILNRKDYSEADRILTVFDVSTGLKKIIAKGSRKKLAHLGGKIELFYEIFAQLVEGKTWDILTEAEIIEDCPSIRNNYQNSLMSYQVSRLAILALKPNNPAPRIYFLLKSTLHLINENMSTQGWLYFVSGLLNELGYTPNYTICPICQKKISLPVKWHIEHGLIHQDCSELGISLDEKPAKCIKLILSDNNIIVKLNLNDKILKSIASLFFEFLCFHTGINQEMVLKD